MVSSRLSTTARRRALVHYRALRANYPRRNPTALAYDVAVIMQKPLADVTSVLAPVILNDWHKAMAENAQVNPNHFGLFAPVKTQNRPEREQEVPTAVRKRLFADEPELATLPRTLPEVTNNEPRAEPGSQ